MIYKKLHISLIFSNLVKSKPLSTNPRMCNLYTRIVKILEICKQFSHNLVNEQGNIPRCDPMPKFSDLEVVALSLTAESESIDSEKWLFDYKLQEYKDKIHNLISRRQYNDRRKNTAGLCEDIRKRIAAQMDGGETQFFVDCKPIAECRHCLPRLAGEVHRLRAQAHRRKGQGRESLPRTLHANQRAWRHHQHHDAQRTALLGVRHGLRCLRQPDEPHQAREP